MPGHRCARMVPVSVGMMLVTVVVPEAAGLAEAQQRIGIFTESLA